MADPDIFRLPFSEAIAYFRRKLNLPAETWKTIQGNETDWAFVIASVTSADMLADFRAAVDRYIADGTGFNQFANEFNDIAQRYGWQSKQGVAWRADIVAKTNLRMAYAAGQYQQRQDPVIKKLRPGLRWVHRDSPQARPHHKAMDGKVFDGNDPTWSGFSLPSGYGCRCRLFSVPAPESGYFNLSDQLPYSLPDGKLTQVPAIRLDNKLYPVADPGFFYTPGASPQSARPAILQQMMQRQPPTLQRLIRQALPQRIVQKFLPRGFANGE